MAKTISENQPILNTDEQHLVDILGSTGLGQVLKAVANNQSSDFFTDSEIDNINVKNINFDNVVLATVVGYEKAVKRVIGNVKPDLVQIAKDYEAIQAKRLQQGNDNGDEYPTDLVDRAELDGTILAYELILNTNENDLSNAVAQAGFQSGVTVAENYEEFYATTNQHFSRELDDFGVDFDTREIVENIIRNEKFIIVLDMLYKKILVK